MFKMIFLKIFLVVAFVFTAADFSLANATDLKQDEGYDLMTENIVCVPVTRDGRVLFSDKQSYAQFAEHLKVAGFNPQVIPYDKLRKNFLSSISNRGQEEIICKDLIFLFLEGFAVFQEEFNGNNS